MPDLGTKIPQGMLCGHKKKRRGEGRKEIILKKWKLEKYLLKSERNSNIYTFTGNEV